MDKKEIEKTGSVLLKRLEEMRKQDEEWCVENNLHLLNAVFAHLRCAVETAHYLAMTKGELVECMENVLSGRGSKYKGIIKMLKK